MSSPAEPLRPYAPRAAGQRLRASDWDQAVTGALAALAAHTHGPASLGGQALAPGTSLSVGRAELQSLQVGGQPVEQALRAAGGQAAQRVALDRVLQAEGGRLAGGLVVGGDLHVQGGLTLDEGLSVGGVAVPARADLERARLHLDDTFDARCTRTASATSLRGVTVPVVGYPEQWVEPVIRVVLRRPATVWLTATGGVVGDADWAMNSYPWQGTLSGELSVLFGIQTPAGRWPIDPVAAPDGLPERRFQRPPPALTQVRWHQHALSQGPAFALHSTTELPAGEFGISAWITGSGLIGPFAVQRLAAVVLPPWGWAP